MWIATDIFMGLVITGCQVVFCLACLRLGVSVLIRLATQHREERDG